MYSNNCSFAVSRMTDTDLNTLFTACANELARRKEQRAQQRAEWITTHYWDFMNHPNASVHMNGQRTIVAIYSRMNGVQIGTAYPINGDVYDMDTGIAVAYAKATGEVIPDFI